MPVSADLRAKVLDDYNAKRVKSATELAKKHGLSRSSVYRILTAEAHAKEVADAKATATGPETTKSVSRPTVVLRNTIETRSIQSQDDASASDSGSDTESDVSDGFFYRSDKFADDLGLPSTSVGVKNYVDEDAKDAVSVDEEEVDAVFSRIAGGSGPAMAADARAPPSKLLDEVLKVPAPPPRRARNPPPPSLPDSNEEEPDDRPIRPRALVRTSESRADTTQRIIFNVEHFHPLLKPIIGDQKEQFLQTLSTRSDGELHDLLTTLERTRSVGNLASGFKQTFYVVGQATEVLTQMVGMRTQGFADQLRAQDEEITMLMKELAMDQWQTLKEMDSPELRLGALFALTLVQTDGQNRMKEQVAHALQGSRVSASTVNAHADL